MFELCIAEFLSMANVISQFYASSNEDITFNLIHLLHTDVKMLECSTRVHTCILLVLLIKIHFNFITSIIFL